MPDFNRRRFLSYVGVGTAVTASSRAQVLLPAGRRPDILEIAEKLRACSHEAAFPVAAELRRAGATWQDLLGGTFLAGVREIKPHPVGFQFHAVMMVESAFQLAAASPSGDRLLPTFFNIDNFKRSQETDRKRGDWVLAPRADRSSLRPAAARRRFEKSMLDHDEAAADRAITSLYASTPMDDLFEIIWPFGGRDFWDIGHKIIYTAHVYRVLERIGWNNALPALRSLTLALLDGPGEGSTVESFAANQKLGRQLVMPDVKAKRDPDASVALVAGLRRAAVADAPGVVVEAWGRGIAPTSIWDGYRLFAAELMMQRPGLLAVHATTAMNGMFFAWQKSKRAATRRVLLLQGASWLAMYRDFLAKRGGKAKSELRIDALLSDGGPGRDAVAAVRHQLFRKGTGTHHYKYAAAMLEDVGLCHPVFAPALFAAGDGYLPDASRGDAAVYRRARKVLG